MWGVTIALVLGALSLVLLYSRWRHQYWQKLGIFVPPYKPILGHMLSALHVSETRYHFFDKYYKKKRDSKLIGMYDIMKPSIFVTDPELVQRVLIKDFDHFVDRRSFDMKGTKDEILNDMLTNATGSHWKGMRSLMTPTFTSGKMKSMFPLVQDKAKALAKHCGDKCSAEGEVDIHVACRKLTMDVIGSCAFGMDINSIGGENKEFIDAANSLFKVSTARFFRIMVFMLFPYFARKLGMSFSAPAMSYFITSVKSTIEKRKEGGTRRGDFMDLMLDARENVAKEHAAGKTSSYTMTDNAIVAQSVLFILAGYDTTANSLSFVFLHLAQSPKYQEEMRKELSERMSKNEDCQLSYQDIMESHYLDAVLNETLRLYPPAHVTERKCTKEYTMPGTSLTVPKDMIVCVPIWSLQRDERYFSDPNSFKPERFLPETKEDFPPGSYLPFGLGPRMCIAQRFALMEAKLAIAHIVMNYSLAPAPGCDKIKVSKAVGVLRPEEDTAKIVLTKLS